MPNIFDMTQQPGMTASQLPRQAPQQGATGKFSGLMGNPLFMMGMGMVSDPQNPLGTGSQYAYNASQYKTLQEQQEEEKALRNLKMKAEAAKMQKMKDQQEAFNKLLPTLDPQQQALARSNPEIFTEQMTKGMAGSQFPSASSTPANVREWEYYSQLPEDQREEYIDLRRGGDRVSSNIETKIFDYSDSAADAQNAIFRYNNMADKVATSDYITGTAGNVAEFFKEITGSEDANSLIRREYTQLVNSEAVNNLPPGVASDKDIELVFDGFIPAGANRETTESFLRGMAKLREYDMRYNQFAANYLSQNLSPIGLSEAWNARASELYKADPRESLVDQYAD